MRERLTSAQFINHFARVLAKAPRGVSDLRDVDAVRNHPDARTPHGWFTVWMERAGAARTLARQAIEWGDAASAASAYLRSSEYYRAAAAAYWPERGDAAVADAMRLHVECFRAALDLDGPPYRPFSIPIGQTALDGYLLQPRAASRSNAVLLCCGPSDGTAEEQYGLVGAEALRQGWWVMLADPGGLERAGGGCDGARQALAEVRAWLAKTMDGEPSRLELAGLGDGAGLAWKLGSGDRAAEVIWPPEGARPAAGPARPVSASDVAALAGALSSLRVPAAVLTRGFEERASFATPGGTACDDPEIE
jgi:hypothetical protein